MKRVNFRLISIIICFSILASVFTGCGTDDTDKDGPPVSPTAILDPDKMDWQLDTSPVTLDVYSDINGFGDWNDPVAERVTGKTGVKLNITTPDTYGDIDLLSLMISTGEFPDIMILNPYSGKIPELIQKGSLNDMDSLMAKYAPKLVDILNNDFGPEVLKNYRHTDGKNYVLYNGLYTKKIMDERQRMNLLSPMGVSSFNVREDYYDEIGRPDTSTPEGLIKAFKDMMGNHPDKIGFLAYDLSEFKYAFGLGGLQFSEINGEVKHQFRDPRYLDMIKLANRFAREGIMSMEGFARPYNVSVEKFQNGDAIGYGGTFENGYEGGRPVGDTGTREFSLLPLKTYGCTVIPVSDKAAVIPKTSKHADRAIRFLEYCASMEGNLDMGYGVQGEKWTHDLENGPHYYFDPKAASSYFPQGKPVIFPEFKAERDKDFDLAANTSGVGKHQILANLAYNDRKIWEWSVPDPRMQKYDNEVGKNIRWRPELSFKIDMQSTIGSIEIEISNLVRVYEKRMAFTKDDGALMALYNEMISKCEEIGLTKLEDEWTKQYKANLDRLGK